MIGSYFVLIAGQSLNVMFHVKMIYPINPINDIYAFVLILVAVFWFILFIAELIRLPHTNDSGEIIVDGRMVRVFYSSL